MKAKVLVIGSINTDLVTYVDRIPAPGETVTDGSFASFPGGKGAQTSMPTAEGIERFISMRI